MQELRLQICCGRLPPQAGAAGQAATPSASPSVPDLAVPTATGSESDWPVGSAGPAEPLAGDEQDDAAALAPSPEAQNVPALRPADKRAPSVAEAYEPQQQLVVVPRPAAQRFSPNHGHGLMRQIASSSSKQIACFSRPLFHVMRHARATGWQGVE